MAVTIDQPVDRVALTRAGQFADLETEKRFRRRSERATVRDASSAFIFGAIAIAVLLAGEWLDGGGDFAEMLVARTVAFLSCLAAFALVRFAPRWVSFIIAGWQVVFTLGLALAITTRTDLALAAVLLLPVLMYLTRPIATTASVGAGCFSSIVMLGFYAVAARVSVDATHSISVPQSTFVGSLVGLVMVLASLNLAMSAVIVRIGRRRRLTFIAVERLRRSTAELSASQALLERTFAAVPIPLFVTEVGTGTILRANQAAEIFFENSSRSIVGQKVVGFYLEPSDRLDFLDAIDEAGGVDSFSARLYRHDGAVRSVALSSRTVAAGDINISNDSNAAHSHLLTAVIDRTEEIEKERRLQASETEYRALFENAVVGIYRSSPDGRMLRGNPALVTLNGYDVETDLVALVNDIAREWYVDPNRREEFKRRMYENGAVHDFVSEIYRHKTRERIWISENAWAIRDPEGSIVCYEGTVVEATERKRHEAENEQLARHDPLTGLANRRVLDERLDQALAGTPQQSCFPVILFLDLDQFKTVNDVHGHAVGDALLVEVASRLRASCRKGDTVVRSGGDEFIILQIGLDQPGSASILAERVLAGFARPFDVEGKSLSVGVSIGIAVASLTDKTADLLLSRADAALYRAKAKGRNRFEFSD